MSSTMRLLLMGSGIGLMSAMAACSQPAQQPDGSYGDPTTRALKDPMNYSPDMDNPDISGGGIGDYHNQSMQKDLNHVLDP